MSEAHHRKYQEAKSRLGDAKDTRRDMSRTSCSARRKQRYWREFLDRAVSSQKMYQDLLEQIGRKDLSDKLWSDLQKDDVLYYLFQARNSDGHVTETVTPIETEVDLVAGGKKIAGIYGDNANITVVGNVLVDERGTAHRAQDLVGKIKNGRFIGEYSGERPPRVSKPHLILMPAFNRGKSYPVPVTADSDDQKFLVFSGQYIGFLDKWDGTCRALLRLPF